MESRSDRYHCYALVLMSCAAGMPVAGQTPAPRPTEPVTTCVTAECHQGTLSGKILHGPVAQKKCEGCHLLTDATGHLFSYVVGQSKLCAFCHTQSNRTVVHEPFAKGDCTGCHDPHGSDHEFILLDDPAGTLCFRCHKIEDFKSRKYVHGPVAAGACIVCHEAHSSWTQHLLVRPEQELCQFCHTETVARLEQVRHVHEPVRGGRCLTCHDPHASDHPSQLRGGAPDLCFSCHEHDPIRRLLATSSNVHGALDKDESCTVCHVGHGGTLPKLLTAPLLTLCLSCHDEPLRAKDGRLLTNMAKLLEDNPNHHGPVRRADCSACHNPHASPNFSLLVKEYPKLFYAPFDLRNYDLCFACHVQELVTVEKGIGVTGFAEGETNLHYTHVHKEKKGRTCRACHEVHASKRPFHIRESVPFGAGGWEIEINFTALDSGGRCVPGCHEAHTYTRSPAGTNLFPEAGLQEGVER